MMTSFIWSLKEHPLEVCFLVFLYFTLGSRLNHDFLFAGNQILGNSLQ